MKNWYNHDKTAIDKQGKISDLVQSYIGNFQKFITKVNLGCGNDYRHDWINIDGDKQIEAEMHCELDTENPEIYLPDESVDLIYASHVLEHIWYLPQLKTELLRMLKPGGYIVVIVPEYTSLDAWGDDTHCRGFSSNSFAPAFWPGCDVKVVQKLNIQKFHDEQPYPYAWILAIMQKEGEWDPAPKVVVADTTEYCRDCGWCCKMANYPIPTTSYFNLERVLKLFYYKGHHVYWEPQNKKWYVMHEDPCQFYDDETKLCKLYGRGLRPDICRSFICFAPGCMYQRHEVLRKASLNILKRKFGEVPDA